MEYIPISQPNAGTLAKIDALQPSSVFGDRKILDPYTFEYLTSPCTAIDAVIVGIETQANYLSSKKTWTRKVIMVTDGENPIEVEDWEATVAKMDGLDVSLTIVFVAYLSLPHSLDSPRMLIAELILMTRSFLTQNLIKLLLRYGLWIQLNKRELKLNHCIACK
jgi:hypothetical protein